MADAAARASREWSRAVVVTAPVTVSGTAPVTVSGTATVHDLVMIMWREGGSRAAAAVAKVERCDETSRSDRPSTAPSESGDEQARPAQHCERSRRQHNLHWLLAHW